MPDKDVSDKVLKKLNASVILLKEVLEKMEIMAILLKSPWIRYMYSMNMNQSGSSAVLTVKLNKKKWDFILSSMDEGHCDK